MTRKVFCTLNELYDRTKAWNESLSDDIVSSEHLAFHSPFGLTYEPEQESAASGLFKAVENLTLEETTNLTDHGFQQLCEKFLVRADWAKDEKKCPEELRKLIFDWKFENYDRADLMIRNRTNGGVKTRAVLSDQYTRYDNLDFIDAVIGALDHADLRDNVRVWRPEISDDMRLYILFDDIQFDADAPPDPTNGDGGGGGGLKPAIYISNSEIGTGRARVHGGLYRSACINGLVMGWNARDKFAQTHRWKSTTHMSVLMNEAIASAMKMSETAAVAFLDSRAAILEPTKINKIITDWGSKYGLLMDARKDWRTLCKVQADREDRLSKFDLINHAADVAGSLENHKAREDMEIMAGDLILANNLPLAGGR